MEPKPSTPNFGPERPSVNYGQSIEPSRGENGERVSEQLERRAELTPDTVETPVLPPPVVAPTTYVTPPVNDSQLADAGQNDNPLVANDDDLIEKEWVNKAKKIIEDTKDDPYRREMEVGKLQADYLRKRYGRELGA